MGQRGCIMFSLDSLKTMLKPQRVSGNTFKFNNFLAIHLLITTVLEQRIQINITSKVPEGRNLVGRFEISKCCELSECLGGATVAPTIPWAALEHDF